MGLLGYAAFLGGVALLGHHLLDMLHSKHPHHFEGEVEGKFEGVREAFQRNFLDGWEAEGASLAVFVKGQKVVDLWGGYADKQAARTWKRDTITVTFSTTKAVAAVCIALLADRGRLRYGDRVSKYWPGFAKNGKDNITIEWVMSHMAGLHYFDTPITEEMARNHDLMRKLIEDEAPKVPAGETSGYHGYTYGWLVDQIVRHTDEKKRGVGQFFREEIAQRNGIDFHIGLSTSDEHRVARLSQPQSSDLLTEIWHDPRTAWMMYNFWTSDRNSPMMRAFSNPSWIDIGSKCTVNSPDQHTMEQAAVLGIGNARSLATLFNLFVNGRVVSEKTLSLLKKPAINGTDYVIQINTVKGHGFFYTTAPGDETELVIGHSGYGCQQMIFDMKNKVVIAYVTNGLKMGPLEGCRNYARIQKAVYDAIKRS